MGEPNPSIGRLQSFDGRTVNDVALAPEPRAVGGAVPGLFPRIPADDRAEVRTRCGTFADRTVRRSVHCKFRKPSADNPSLAWRNLLY